MPLLFVYGTLKRGCRNHRFLVGQQFLGPARTAPCYRLYDRGRYPCLVEAGTGGVAVEGELWRIDASLLPALDEYEEAPTLFARRFIAIQGVTEPVLGYLFQQDVTGLPDCGTHWHQSGPVEDPHRA